MYIIISLLGSCLLLSQCNLVKREGESISATLFISLMNLLKSACSNFIFLFFVL